MPFKCLMCGKCCLMTEMVLTPSDVRRIEGLGYRASDFSVLGSDGLLRLRNVRGRCYFLGDDGRCKIYPHRPLGCRIYPVIVVLDERVVTVDTECPAWRTVTLSDVLERRPLIERVLRELGLGLTLRDLRVVLPS